MKNFKLKDEDPPSMAENNSEDSDAGGEGKTPNKSDQLPEEIRPSLLKRVRLKLARSLHLRSSNSIEKEVAELIDEHDPEGTQVGSEERSILNNILQISDKTINDVMVPRTDIIAVDKNISLKELTKIIIDKEHTRTPVYQDSLDNVIGFLHIKDLIPILGSDKPFHIAQILREILYVPPSMKILDLLVTMRNKRVHVALVLDEYGGTDGLVTMEDLMEEIVGEIEDEHDEIEEVAIKEISDGIFEVNARMPIKDLEERLDIKLKEENDDEDFGTVGGLVFFLLGHVPEKGETANHTSGLEFEVIDASPRRINKLIVKTSK